MDSSQVQSQMEDNSVREEEGALGHDVEGHPVQGTMDCGDSSVREEHAVLDTGGNELGDMAMVEDGTGPSADVRTVLDEVVSPSDISGSSDDETVRKCVRAMASESIDIHKAAVTALKLVVDCTHGGGTSWLRLTNHV